MARVTAMTMPTMRPASNTSRKTIISAASMDASLLHDQRASGFGVEVVEKIVAAGRERSKPDDAFAVSGDHLLYPERYALKLHRGCVAVLYLQHDRFVGCLLYT